MKRWSKVILIGVAGVVSAGVLTVGVLAFDTSRHIGSLRDLVVATSGRTTPPPWKPESVTTLPAPVQRWVRYTFRSEPVPYRWVSYDMKGRFRRPHSDDFNATTARQVSAIGAPAMVFDATTPVFGVLWARAYDAYIDGHMTMRAAILSALTVVNESPSPVLDRISLRRWLIESAMYPAAMLPGGVVSWEAMDDHHARAVVKLGDVQASLVATFADDGRLTQFDAEEDGDLQTPYHGSGEQLLRDDYRLIQGIMIPHRFRVARAAGGQVYPFWEGEVTAIRLGLPGETL